MVVFFRLLYQNEFVFQRTGNNY